LCQLAAPEAEEGEDSKVYLQPPSDMVVRLCCTIQRGLMESLTLPPHVGVGAAKFLLEPPRRPGCRNRVGSSRVVRGTGVLPAVSG
jgi:hypothetical protein